MFLELFASLEEMSVAFAAFMQKEILYSSTLFVIVFALTRLLKRQSIYLHYGLWALVLIRLILPPDWSFSFSARSIMDRTEWLDPKSSAATSLWMSEPSSEAPSSGQLQTGTVSQRPVQGTALPEQDKDSGLTVSWQLVVFLSWLAGSLALLAIFLKRYLFYLRVIKRSAPVADSKVQKLAQDWQRRFQIGRPVRFVSSDICLSPFTVGIFKPVVYLPSGLLADRERGNLESVVAHELAHVKQFDDLWIKFQNAVQLVYFFHPLVWLANSQLNQARERICDELVLSHGTISPKAYGKSMLAILKMNLLGVEGVEMLPSFGNHKKKFSSRITEITRMTKIRRSNRLWTVGLVFALAIFLLPMAENSFLQSSQGVQIIKLKRASELKSDFGIHSQGAGSHFQKTPRTQANEMFCESNLPSHLTEMEFAALGLYDTDYRKIWLLKGKSPTGEMEFYLDTNGDACFTDEQPLNIKKKTAKYHYEGESEWVLSTYLKSQVMIEYQYRSQRKIKNDKFPVYLVYDSKLNLLQFDNYDFWIGEADFGDRTYPIALYGGLKARWYLRPTFDDTPQSTTKNQLRIDLNGNNVFEDMTVFDPATNEVVQENYLTGEAISVMGKSYEVKGIWHKGNELVLKLMLKPEMTQVGEVSSSKS